MQNSGVHRLDFYENNVVYIEQTGRKQRYKEHIQQITYKTTISNFAKHIIETDHKVKSDYKPKILYLCNKSKRLIYLEALEINNVNFKLSERFC